MSDPWNLQLINHSSVLYNLILMDGVNEDEIHKYINRMVQIPFGSVIDINLNAETGINLIKDIINKYNTISKLNLLNKFNNRFNRNLKNAFTQHGEYVFEIIQYEFQKMLYKIDKQIYSFDYNELQ
ncbi:unnamed protein product [Macrosiphum euphorbiae]|uniref:Uncharacterized protein n=1 Tax=Macrosiphum euphorbiae TaxID=13131 RepID=A0AAV0Y947_9HEMI|nr:unnamed protein product [Macrosiphum euphorbiae]